MKINPITNPNILRSYQATKPTRETTRLTNGRDEVTFSAEALSFSKALAEARETIEFRSPEEKERIDEIKYAVDKGEYVVNSNDVADRILSSILGPR